MTSRAPSCYWDRDGFCGHEAVLDTLAPFADAESRPCRPCQVVGEVLESGSWSLEMCCGRKVAPSSGPAPKGLPKGIPFSPCRPPILRPLAS